MDDRQLQPRDGRRESAGQQADGNTQPRWRGAKRPRHRPGVKLRGALARPLLGEGLQHLASVSFAKAVTGGSSA